MAIWRAVAVAFMAVAAAGIAGAAGPSSSRELWQQYVANPNAHPNIPNCSYAGYRNSDVPLPTVKVVANVRAAGAKADGKTDDAAAFKQAIEQAHKAGGGAVLVPAGTYALSGMIHLKHSNVVLRGEGVDKTTLVFNTPLGKLAGANRSAGKIAWSWMGGLVWVGPEDTFDERGQLGRGGESWRNGQEITKVTVPAKRGDFQVKVAATAGIKPGDFVLLSYENVADHSLLIAMAGHERMKGYNWAKDAAGLVRDRRWDWCVEVASISGNTLTLKQPLRVDIRPEWNVTVTTPGQTVREVGVEGMTLKMVHNERNVHLMDIGFNGIYINRAINCWVKDVKIVDAQNGIGVASVKNVTVTGFHITGRPHHHATALRNAAQDVLWEKFLIDSRPMHGINTEGLATGNVWRDGVMKHGTFDSHRAMSFEFIRTNITIHNDGKPGGGSEAGPFLGARVVHWNIRATGSSEFVNQPDCISDGALVGIQGVPISNKGAWAMVPGDKNCIIVDQGKVPEPPDLFEAQLKLRQGKR